MNLKGIILLTSLITICGSGYSQSDSFQIQQITNPEITRLPAGLKYPTLVKQFYQHYPYKTAWVQDTLLIRQLLNRIKDSRHFGLQENDYQPAFLLSLQKGPALPELKDSILADFLLTDAAIHFFRDMVLGNAAPATSYTGIKYNPDCIDVPSLLSASLQSGSFHQFIEQIENNSPEYIALKKELLFYHTAENNKNPERLPALGKALNTVRWLSCLRKQAGRVIVVNIPSATLLVYGPDSVLLESKVIVGKTSTRTPTLSSTVTEVVLYPYWMVPHKIATRELLPMIKRNPAYIDNNNFQVLDKNGKIKNPAAINWNALSADNFPYTLRQSTGCDNSLGIVKLNFHSPFSVYLHDTPWKALFHATQRFFSHGCIRVEKAMELAKLLLPGNTAAIDSLIGDNPPPDHPPVHIPVDPKVPVLVLYNTAWIDSGSNIRFYSDVYNKYPKYNNKKATLKK